jgi:hypothetical protein
MNVIVKYGTKLPSFMTKYYTYSGKQIGLIRKMMDDTVLIEEAWISEVNRHLGRNGYDGLLSIVAQVLSAGGHPAVTRAQAWIVLGEVFKAGVPEVLQDANVDESSSKGNLFASAAKGAVSAAERVANPVGKVVGGMSSAVRKVGTKSSEVPEDDKE